MGHLRVEIFWKLPYEIIFFFALCNRFVVSQDSFDIFFGQEFQLISLTSPWINHFIVGIISSTTSLLLLRRFCFSFPTLKQRSKLPQSRIQLTCKFVGTIVLWRGTTLTRSKFHSLQVLYKLLVPVPLSGAMHRAPKHIVSKPDVANLSAVAQPWAAEGLTPLSGAPSKRGTRQVTYALARCWSTLKV